MWLQLLENATGSHRTLFFKGDSKSGHRTPSVWLLPNANRLTLRATTIRDIDLGAESHIEIPLDSWTLLSLTFCPSSSSSSLHSSQYKIQLYVNNTLDISLTYQDEVLGNSYPFHLLHDGTHVGPKCIVTNLTLWQGELTLSRINSLFDVGIPSTVSHVVDMMTHLGLTSTMSTIFKTTTSSEYDELLMKIRTFPSLTSKLSFLASNASQGSMEALFLWSQLTAFGVESVNDLRSFSSSSSSSSSLFDWNRSSHPSINMQAAFVGYLASFSFERSFEALVPLAIMLLSEIGLPSSSLSFDQDLLDLIPLSNDLKVRLVRWTYTRGSKTLSFLESVLKILSKGRIPSASREEDMELERINSQISLAIALLFSAVIHHNDDEARAILAHLFDVNVNRNGHFAMFSSFHADDETTAFYLMTAARQASIDFHTQGSQPILQSDRIDDFTETRVIIGNKGDEDELIRLQLLRGKEGHLPSILASADLFYYGARGVVRDQTIARDLYLSAARLGSLDGMVAAAGMYLKGEGDDRGQKNISQALVLYEEAAEKGNLRALNGLGYIYFYGNQVEKNESLAFSFFQRAAGQNKDGDSIFNAAYCLLHGIGIKKNLKVARDYLEIAASQHGHFDAVSLLGILLYEGQSSREEENEQELHRSVREALRYLRATVGMGSHQAWLRRGLDSYIAKDYWRSLLSYVRASFAGFEVAQSNAAFLLTRKIPRTLPRSTGASSSSSRLVDAMDELQTHLHHMSSNAGNADSMVFLGHAYHEGIGVKEDQEKAIKWYLKAAQSGQPLGSFYFGLMHHLGSQVPQNLEEAQRHYRHTLELCSSSVKRSSSALLPTSVLFEITTQTLLFVASSPYLTMIFTYGAHTASKFTSFLSASVSSTLL